MSGKEQKSRKRKNKSKLKARFTVELLEKRRIWIQVRADTRKEAIITALENAKKGSCLLKDEDPGYEFIEAVKTHTKEEVKADREYRRRKKEERENESKSGQ